MKRLCFNGVSNMLSLILICDFETDIHGQKHQGEKVHLLFSQRLNRLYLFVFIMIDRRSQIGVIVLVSKTT